MYSYCHALPRHGALPGCVDRLGGGCGPPFPAAMAASVLAALHNVEIVAQEAGGGDAADAGVAGRVRPVLPLAEVAFLMTAADGVGHQIGRLGMAAVGAAAIGHGEFAEAVVDDRGRHLDGDRKSVV